MKPKRIGVVGTFQNGKSSLINCIVGKKVAQTGGMGTSVTNKTITYSIDKDTHIIDTPGFNANEDDTTTAIEALKKIDIAVLVLTNKTLGEMDRRIMSHLESSNVPYIALMNCMKTGGDSTWNPSSDYNMKKKSELQASLLNHKFSPLTVNDEKILSVNVIWYWYAIGGKLLDYEESLIKNYQKNNPHVDLKEESMVSIITKCLGDGLLHYQVDILMSLMKENKKLMSNLINAVKNVKTSN